MPDEAPLTRATEDELLQALAYALRFDERGKPHRAARDDMARIAAQTIARYLDMAGFVVMKRPPRPAHGTPKAR
jgi:hypothetical protein